ncbi:helix-hairpin-helix domain-containing protein [Pseudoxanthomonas daejeonensis]|uniref:ComEA family DNA-binding protein n=1 Tax=Pseudoxanthomonas daejeonensis TaxID=266062 RepID=UPI001F541809|nr:helix-hairpin-helix domain-containing protein [Pseudoxanthomonas daejeonensis]UNK56898.1 helix-hairpin-helix domain-containing protein [Pseudoxanthomonas daejeonensis]
MKPFPLMFKSLLLSLLLLAGSAFAADRVDINVASAAQLEKSLVGIGPSKAEAIVEYRKANGPFKSADELALVKGIGLKTVERNRDLIAVGGSRAAPAKAKPAAAATPSKPVARR